MMTLDDQLRLEDEMRRLIAIEQRRRHYSDKRLADLAFAGYKSPSMKLQAIMVAYPRRRVQTIRFADLVNICEALGIDWYSSVCLPALQTIQNAPDK